MRSDFGWQRERGKNEVHLATELKLKLKLGRKQTTLILLVNEEEEGRSGAAAIEAVEHSRLDLKIGRAHV